MLNKIILRNADEDNWLCFSRPVDVFDIHTLGAVLPTLERIEQRVNDDALYAAGFISYEAAPAFDPACTVKHDAGFPLLRFGLFDSVEVITQLDDAAPLNPLSWQMDSAPAYYRKKIDQIKTHIHAGDTYQVNYTVRQYAEAVNSAWSLFCQLGTDSPYAAYIDCDDWAICSASPELFFQLDGNALHSRPMKGTAARGASLREDEEQKSWLRNSQKNRAENVMIVDMIRNDIGRVAVPGSVTAAHLFRVETYPTVLQMTSTVSAQTHSSVTQIMQALFPCASITGAPKVNTMRLITALEDSPRRIYTGAIGYIGPQRKARFSVAIRTALVNRRTGQACYGSGGGIVWDSNASEELAEIATKSHILGRPGQRGYFRLIESLLWTGSGYFLLERHITRMLNSAMHFAFTGREAAIRQKLDALQAKLPNCRCKVRLLLAEDGALSAEYAVIDKTDTAIKTARLSPFSVDENSIWLRHKTTIRTLYDEALAACEGADQVLLYDRQGLLTESATANIAIKVAGCWLTPSPGGLLPGTFRAEMIARGELTETDIPQLSLVDADEIRLLNSVREWIPVKLLRSVKP